MEAILLSCDAIAVIFAAIASWYSVSLMKTITREKPEIGWWILLPLVVLYAFVDRILVLLAATGVIGSEWNSIAPSIIVAFYIGFAIFIYSLNKVTNEIIDNCEKENGEECP